MMVTIYLLRDPASGDGPWYWTGDGFTTRISEAKHFLNEAHARLYAERVPQVQDLEIVSAVAWPDSDFFAVRGGAR